jgi:multiple sugar transport system substrate-binding protein
MDIFIQGKIGMQVGLPPTVGQIEEGNPELDYSIVPIPTEDGSPFTLGVMDQLMAFENDGDKQEAITKFFDYYYSADVYVPWVQAEGFLPVTKSGLEKFADDPKLKVYLDTLPNVHLTPTDDPTWDKVKLAVQQNIGKAVEPDGDPKAVLDTLQKLAENGG